MSRLSRTLIAAVVAVGAVLGVTQITSGANNSTKESVFVGLVPARLLDTRQDQTTFDGFDQAVGRLDAGTTYELDIAGRAGVPTDALSVTANLVAVNPSGPGYLTVYPCGFDKPLAAALNYTPGVDNANEFSVPLGEYGDICIYTHAETDIVVDIYGYYTTSTATGEQGPTGPQGLTGPQGPTGTGITAKGSIDYVGPPLFDGTETGDVWIDTNNEAFVWTEQGAWDNVGAISGPAGANGSPNRITDKQIAMHDWHDDPGAPATINVGTNPRRGLGFDGINIYVANHGSDTVSVINPASGAVTTITDPSFNQPFDIEYDGTNIYVTNFGGATVSVIDPNNKTVVDTIPTEIDPWGMAHAGTDLYITHPVRNSITVVDLNDYDISTTITDTRSFKEPIDIIYNGTNIYVANRLNDTVAVIDPADNTVIKTIDVGDGPEALAYTGAKIYITNRLDDSVSVVDPATNTVTDTIDEGFNTPMGIAYDGTNLYVANNQGSSVSVIDPARNTVTYTIPAGDRPRGVDYDGTNVWVTNAGDNTVSKLPPR